MVSRFDSLKTALVILLWSQNGILWVNNHCTVHSIFRTYGFLFLKWLNRKPIFHKKCLFSLCYIVYLIIHSCFNQWISTQTFKMNVVKLSRNQSEWILIANRNIIWKENNIFYLFWALKKWKRDLKYIESRLWQDVKNKL